VGFDQVDRIAMSDLDLSAVDLKRPSSPAKPVRGGGELQGRIQPIAYRTIGGGQQAQTPGAVLSQKPGDVRELIARAVRAKGGTELLRSIRTIKAVSTNTLVDAPGGPVELPVTTSIKYPSSFRVDAGTPDGPLVQVFNGGDFWVQDAKRGARPMAQPVADEIRANVQRDSIPMLLGLADGKLSGARLADAADGAPVIEVKSPGMPAVAVTLDPATALITRVRYVAAGGVTVEETFSDYRDVKGIKVAFKATVSRNGVRSLERVLRSFEYNIPLDATLFTRPS
jgi:hypothetical protein